MPHLIDRAKTPYQNLIDLINTGSNYAFDGTEFLEISTITPYNDEFDISNTEITLSASPNSGFEGEKTIRYRRLAPGATKVAALLDYEITSQDDFESLKEIICAEHNLISSEINLIGNLPEVVGVPVQVGVFFPEWSLVYLTGTMTVNVTLVA